ncbi:glycosyl transferase [Microbacterium album]|uniref:DUF8094 domain-containing protein n=1 Tax=Microbacterium album TaxID=2053191 RepID=A0A917MKZ4_9MICO|nr:glycosyl transferase [Microbacterium album]GGH39320.1 hypothetical protein GCM10010921_10460 [Microbacterium album]
MRFVWAVVAFVIAAALIGAGIAQRTVFLGPDTATLEVEADASQPYTLIDSEVFRSHTGTQTLEIAGSERIYAAYGRTDDMRAWLSDAPYNHVTVDDEGNVGSTVVQPEGGEDFPGRDPEGSDLWLQEYSAESELTTRLQLPEGVSMLIASDGTQPAPADVSIVWPISNATPWAGPLIVAGALMLLLGLVLYVLGVRHLRRSRGPRRKGPAVPPTEPVALPAGRRRGPAVGPAEDRKQLTGPEGSDADSQDEPAPETDGPSSSGDSRASGGRGLRRRGGRALVAVPVFALSAALLAGCSPDVWPELGGTPSPSPTPTVVAPENQQPPALTDAQAERILASISETVAQADEARDAELAATRLEGIALEMREVNYRIRGEVEDHPGPQPIPAGSLEILLPQAFDEWPRSAMVIVEADGEESAPPSILMLTQADPWSNYRATTIASMEAAVEIPDLAPSWLGAALVPPDSSFLALPPNEVAAAYADVLAHGEQSEFADLFDLSGDSFRVAAEQRRADTLAHFNETGQETGSIEFHQRPGPTEPVALATLGSGAIVAVTVDEIETVRPLEEDAVIKLDADPAISTLTGETSTPTGVETTYTDQLYFAVPAQGSTERIRLLGYSSGLRDARILEEE